MARVAVAAGDYNTAVKEMKLALPQAPDALKGQVRDLIQRLERRVDINKYGIRPRMHTDKTNPIYPCESVFIRG